jgi:phosphotransferase system enzyme I (PtsI)
MAVLVRSRAGVAIVPPVPLSVADMVAKRQIDEKPDIILVSEEYETALLVAPALQWGTVVGIAASTAGRDAAVSRLPAVVDIPTLLGQITDGMLMVVDAERATVFADPDGIAIAKYQAEHDHLAPRRRLHLDSPHLPAQTLDGHTLQVVATVDTPEAMETALFQGADSLFVPYGSSLFPEAEAEIQRGALFSLVDLVEGKPLILDGGYFIDPLLALEAAARVDLTVTAKPRMDLPNCGLGELAETWRDVEQEVDEEDLFLGAPRLAALSRDHDWLPEADEGIEPAIERLASCGATRLFVFATSSSPTLSPADEARLVRLAGAAQRYLLPVFAYLETPAGHGSGLSGICLAAGMGAAGVLTLPECVAEMKQAIREISVSECSERLFTSR